GPVESSPTTNRPCSPCGTPETCHARDRGPPAARNVPPRRRDRLPVRPLRFVVRLPGLLELRRGRVQRSRLRRGYVLLPAPRAQRGLPRLRRARRLAALHLVARVVPGEPAARPRARAARLDRVVHHRGRRPCLSGSPAGSTPASRGSAATSAAS